MNRKYHVSYKMFFEDIVHHIIVFAPSKEKACDLAFWEEIPKREKEYPYSAWTEKVEFKNGSYQMFNTFEGKPY